VPTLLGVTVTEQARALWERSSGPLSTTAYVMLGVLGSAVIGTVASSSGFGVVLGLWAGGCGLLLSLLLVRRRRWPEAIASICAVGTLVAFTYAAAWLALLALAIRRRDRWLVLITAVAWAGSIASAVTLGFEPLLGMWLATPMYGFAVAAGAYIGSRRALMVSLRERAERAEAEQAMRSHQARVSERSRIAQEMHDVLAHKISLVTLQAGGLEVNPAAGPDEVERVAGLIRTTARQALDDLREVLGVLRGTEETGAPRPPVGPGPPAPDPGTHRLAPVPTLAPQPGLADVRELVEASRRSGVPVRLDWDVVQAPVPDLVGRTVFRVVQEALTNVHKHAHGVSVSVLVRGRPGGRIDVDVANPRPVGSSVEPLLPGTGSGLDGIAERVRLAGGQVQAGPTPDGFRVRAWVPWPLPTGPVPRLTPAALATLPPPVVKNEENR
jgi:signal transduction histidine kinase